MRSQPNTLTCTWLQPQNDVTALLLRVTAIVRHGHGGESADGQSGDESANGQSGDEPLAGSLSPYWTLMIAFIACMGDGSRENVDWCALWGFEASKCNMKTLGGMN